MLVRRSKVLVVAVSEKSSLLGIPSSIYSFPSCRLLRTDVVAFDSILWYWRCGKLVVHSLSDTPEYIVERFEHGVRSGVSIPVGDFVNTHEGPTRVRK